MGNGKQTTVYSPVINYSAQIGWDGYIDISNKRAPDVVNLIDEHPDIDLRQTALNLLKLEINIEVLGIKYRQSQMQDLEEEEKNATLKEEHKKLNNIKDPNAKIWKIRTSILGPKHKAPEPEPTCIRHQDTGELVARPEEIKKISLEQKIQLDHKIRN